MHLYNSTQNDREGIEKIFYNFQDRQFNVAGRHQSKKK